MAESSINSFLKSLCEDETEIEILTILSEKIDNKEVLPRLLDIMEKMEDKKNVFSFKIF